MDRTACSSPRGGCRCGHCGWSSGPHADSVKLSDAGGKGIFKHAMADALRTTCPPAKRAWRSLPDGSAPSWEAHAREVMSTAARGAGSPKGRGGGLSRSTAAVRDRATCRGGALPESGRVWLDGEALVSHSGPVNSWGRRDRERRGHLSTRWAASSSHHCIQTTRGVMADRLGGEGDVHTGQAADSRSAQRPDNPRAATHAARHSAFPYWVTDAGGGRLAGARLSRRARLGGQDPADKPAPHRLRRILSAGVAVHPVSRGTGACQRTVGIPPPRSWTIVNGVVRGVADLPERGRRCRHPGTRV